MGSKVVIVRLEVPDAGEELSALELTWAPGTDQGMVAISSLSATDASRLVLETPLEWVAGRQVQPGDESVADAWDAFGNKLGQISGKQLEVVTHQWASADGSYIVRRVSFLKGGKWILLRLVSSCCPVRERDCRYLRRASPCCGRSRGAG